MKIENNWFWQWVMVLLVISLQGKANGKQENSLIDDGKGPLKSIFSHWNGNMAFMSVPLLLVMNFGFK